MAIPKVWLSFITTRTIMTCLMLLRIVIMSPHVVAQLVVAVSRTMLIILQCVSLQS